jgi:predicted RNA binding protein YcfA (HicA-like mRNA interferase family)
MSQWGSAKSRKVLQSLLSIGWQIKRQAGSHKVHSHSNYPDFVFAFHEGVEIGPKMLSRIAKQTGLKPQDL